MATIKVCDACGEEIMPGEEYGTAVLYVVRADGTGTDQDRRLGDMCAKCVEKLRRAFDKLEKGSAV